MRYHLWFAPVSRPAPHGVRDSGAVTGAPGLSPTGVKRVQAAAPRCIHRPALSPSHLSRGLSAQGHIRLLFLLLAVGKLYHSFSPLSRQSLPPACESLLGMVW